MSSTTSLLDSSASSILGASTLIDLRENRPVQGKPNLGFGAYHHDDNESQTAKKDGDKNNGHRNLLQRRIYPAISVKESYQKDDSVATPSTSKPLQDKSELEEAVLMDCLSNNFLFSQVPKAELQALVAQFEKVQFRKNEIIARLGDAVAYLYVVYLGEVKILNQDGEDITSSKATEKYIMLGELEILTNSVLQASVKATSSTCTLFRLSKQRYQQSLHQPHSTTEEDRIQLLKEALPEELVEYLEEDEFSLKRLVSGMSTHSFTKGDILYRKETRLAALVIIAQGKVTATEISMGGRAYEDMAIGPGESKTSFGWQSILQEDSKTNNTTSSERMTGTIVGTEDGVALVITKKTFSNALGGYHHGSTSLQQLAAKRLARTQLQQITVFKDSALDDTQINGLLDLMHHCEYQQQETIFKAGEKVEAAMYFVREGSVTLEMNRGQEIKIIEAGGYFGEKNMLLDQNKDGRKHFHFRSPMTAIAADKTKVDFLYLEECRQVVDTTRLGLGQAASISAIDETIQWKDITRHTLLGSGSFGQVWLASIPDPKQPEDEESNISNQNQSRRIVALKVQAKHHLVQSPDKAQRIVAEKNVMASLHSPFIIRLLNAFQDDKRLYMITSILQGGELESLIPQDGLSESAAKFYALGILEALAYMHRRHIIHRDVKSENCLINAKGYPVLIDLGFAKYVPDKTYTFCGSPMLTAPEIIRYKGYDRGVDNWSWGVLVYRLVTGKYPFYEKGMDELALYKRICRGTFDLDGTMSMDFRMLMAYILYPDPAQRLGSRVNGWRDIFSSAWLANEDPLYRRKFR